MTDKCKRFTKHLSNARRELRKAHAITKASPREFEQEMRLVKGDSDILASGIMEAEVNVDTLLKTMKLWGCK